MTTKIQKWGNSLAVRIPKNIVDEVDLEEGSPVVISPELNRIIIKRITEKKENLKEVVKKITSSNKHKEVLWGTAVGNEVW